MPVKVTRKYTYVVEGKEYTDQKEANDAAKKANQSEKRVALAQMIEEATSPLTAAAAIMDRFHVFNKTEGAGEPGVKRFPRKKRGKAYEMPQVGKEDQLS
jgi:hypothetical protein